MRVPVRIKIPGGLDRSLTPGTDWRVDRVIAHYEPGGIVGEVPPEYTLIDFAPTEPAAPAALDVEWRDGVRKGIERAVHYLEGGHRGHALVTLRETLDRARLSTPEASDAG